MDAAGVGVGVHVGRTTARAVTIGAAPVVMPAVLHIGERLSFGTTAEDLAVREPERVVRGLIDRVGDPVPVVIGGSPHLATPLLGAQLQWLAATAAAAASVAADVAPLAIVVPPGWGRFRHEALREAVPGAALIPSAVAAVIAAGWDDGDPVVVVHLGGAGSSIAVLDAASADAGVLRSIDLAVVSGALLDDAVYALVSAMVGPDLEGLAPHQLVSVRRSCVAAKERLSTETAALVEVGGQSIRVTRGELEDAATPGLLELATSVQHAIAAAGVEVQRLLVHGGAANMPLVAALLGERTGLAVTLAADAQSAAARGAATWVGATPAAAAPASPLGVVSLAVAGSTVRLDVEVGAVGQASTTATAAAAFVLPEDPAPTGVLTELGDGVEDDAPSGALGWGATLHVTPSPPTDLDLCVVGGIGVGRRASLDRSVVVGRSRAADVQIDDVRLSRRHLEVDPAPPVTVVDLGSTNGSFIDGGPIAARRPLLDSVVEAGNELLRCRATRTTAVSGPATVRRWPRVRRVQPSATAEDLRAEHPDVDRLLSRALLRRGDLFERRPWHHDFLAIRVGWCDTELADGAVVRAVPLAVRLPSTGRLRVRSSPASLGDGFLQHVVAQLVLLHGPDDLGLDVAGALPESWDWVARLPHTGAPAATRLLLSGAGSDSGTAGHLELLVDDTAAPQPGELDIVLDGPLGEVAVPQELVVAGSAPARPDVLGDGVAEAVADALEGLTVG